jgi:Fur family transcriptional regulator, zinc uptake regulator
MLLSRHGRAGAIRAALEARETVNQKAVIQGFPQPDHDHAQCIEDALARAEAVCRDRGERFTTLRRLVFELVWTSHRPVKAYELLERVLGHGRRGSPPTVYRALDFLQSAGLVHKIESLNAFVGCADPARPHSGQFLICDQCGTVAELEDAAVAARLDADAKRLGFNLDAVRIEATGRCRDCRRSDGAAQRTDA